MTNSIFSSIQNNDLKSLEFYVFSKKNLNILDENGFSLLYWAIRTNQLSAMKLLIDNKIDINFQDFQGNTALHIATQTKFVHGVELLLKSKANPNLTNLDGNLPLHLCCTFGQLSSSLIDLLYPLSDINAQNLAKFTPLQLALKTNRNNQNRSIISLLTTYESYLNLNNEISPNFTSSKKIKI